MATANFTKYNANYYYVLLPTYEDEKGNTIEKDDIDFENDMDCIIARGEDKGFSKYNGREFALGDTLPLLTKLEYPMFGKKEWDGDINVFRITVAIYVHSGHYTGANLDYDIIVDMNYTLPKCLSDFSDADDMAEEALEEFYDDCREMYSEGYYKLMKDKAKKWLSKTIEDFAEEADNFCKECCDEVYGCMGVFSNGEAVYHKVS